MAKKKRYKIENKVNPIDDWKKYKTFSDLDKAKQSFNMCIKHVSNIFKNSTYDKFRLIDTKTDEVLDDSSTDTHIFFE